MKVQLERNGELESFLAVADIRVYERNREDLSTLLNAIDSGGTGREELAQILGIGEQGELVASRIIEYLRGIQLIDANNNLTPLGKYCASNKVAPVNEAGQYQFWMLRDTFLGEMIVGYAREKSIKNQNGRRGDLASLETKSFRNALDGNSFELRRFHRANKGSNEVYVHTLAQKELGSYKLTIDFDTEREDAAIGKISGSIQQSKRSGDVAINYSHDNIKLLDGIDFFEILKNFISQSRTEWIWDSENQAFMIPAFGDITNSELVNFNTLVGIVEASVPGCGVFDDTVVSNVPIMPSNKDMAVQWYMKCMEVCVSEGYISSDELDEKIIETKKRKEFSKYNQALNVINKQDIVDNLKRINFNNYWNIIAPEDLCPFSIKNPAANVFFSVKIGDKYAMNDIVHRLCKGMTSVDHVAICCKYVDKNAQIGLVKLFAECFREKFNTKDITLVTEMEIGIPDINVLTYARIFGDRARWPHDRYLAIHSQGIWHYYKMTANLDRCRFEIPISQWKTSTIGTWGDISFLPHEAPSEFSAYIEKSNGAEV